MGFNIEIDYDTVDNIFLDILKNQYKSLKEDLQNRIDGKEAFGIFSVSYTHLTLPTKRIV